MNTITHLVRPDLQQFTPYSSARDEKMGGKIFLNANESPWEYSAFLENIILNRYPQKQPVELIPELAALYQVQPDQIVMLRGSDEPIDLLTRLFCTAGQDAIMICTPTFGMYTVCAQLQGVRVIEVPTFKANNFELNFADILDKWTPEVKIIYLCTPNNPTGNLLNPADILNLCQQLQGKSIVVVDEAYIEFSAQHSMSNYLNQYENLAVLRTFSKVYGLAAARCGFLLAGAEMIDWIKRIAPPYPLSSFVIQIVAQVLSTQRITEVQEHIKLLQTEREHLFSALHSIPSIKKIWPSAANFLLMEVDDARKMMTYCDDHGFVLRSMHNKPQLENCIRITIGRPEENKMLIKLLQDYADS